MSEPKLLDRVRAVACLCHLSLGTERTYSDWIRRFILFHRKRHPNDMGAAEIRQFLSLLAVSGHVSASTQNQALCARLFLYRGVLKVELGNANVRTTMIYMHVLNKGGRGVRSPLEK